MFRASNFDKLLDKATSNLRLDPDWPTILQICDLIRQNDCTPKYAISAIKKKLYSQNPHQAMFALLTLESIVKNCGSGVHDEVASKAVCEMLRDLVKSTQHENLRDKILELIQAWAFAFRNTPKYRSVQDTVNILKAECFKFPPLKESDAMFSADTAPEWADGEVCHRCRVAFTLMVRRHHCRACGQVFCQQCSAKTSTLPKFGIEKEVRVCDACYDKVSRPPSSSAKLDIVDTSNDYGPAVQAQKKTGKSAEELQEEEELQLALALSQSEAEQKEKDKRSRSHIAPSTAVLQSTVSPTPSSVSVSPEHSTSGNAELSRYLDRGYWEQRRDTAAAPTAPAPASQTSSSPNPEYMKPTKSRAQEDDEEDKEIDEFVSSLKSQVEIFVNRMKSNSSRGRSIANDTAVQSLFMNITAMHSRLLRYIQQQDDKRVYLESLQDKVTQIRDSRAALDTLRAEHAARLAAAAEAADRQRQMQMAAKLQAMRKKKHEYLQYQRQLALQRVQEQEREMQMRQEQQKHQYLMSGGGNYFMPGVTGVHQFQPAYASQSIYNNQYHPQMMPQSNTESNLQISGQPLMNQPNMQNMTVAQPIQQLQQAYPMSTASGATLSQVPNTQSMQQANIRQPGVQPMSVQSQILMQQMHQLRLSSQQGMPQNGFTGQNIPQTNGQSTQQVAKQNIPNQPPNTTSIMGVGQQQINPSNPMVTQIPGMRMPFMQGTQPGQMSAYSMNISNPQIGQAPNIQQQSQMHMQGQPMSLPSIPNQQILPGQSMPNMSMQNHIPNNQNIQAPHVPQSQGQQLPQQQQMSMPNMSMAQMNMQMMQGQPMIQTQSIPQPGQQIMNQGQQQIPVQNQQLQSGQAQQVPQGHPQMSQGQPQLQQVPQQMSQGQPQLQQVPQQMPQGQPQVSQGQPQMPQAQPQIVQGQPQMAQGQSQMMQGQPQMVQGQPQMAQGQPQLGQAPPQMVQGPSQMQQGQPQMPQPQGQMQQPHQIAAAGQQFTQTGQARGSFPQVSNQAPLQQVSQGQQMPQVPPVKMPQQNFATGTQPSQPVQNVQSQQAQTNSKSEHNNNTAELINFD